MGQTEAPLVIKPYLAKMTRSEIMALMTGGMATIAGGVAFLVLHANEWRTLIEEGMRTNSNPWGNPLFGATFFTITGLHMLHVTIGVFILLFISFGYKSGKYPADYVEISGLYWHFVDLVWMFVFPLIYLLSVAPNGASGAMDDRK